MSNQIVKPSILPGFMELLPADQILFNKMMDTIRKNYEKFGFIPLDTPLIEKSEVLLAKSGGETEKQIYQFTKGDTDMALRFDLTVPLARYVAQHFSDLNFPFRRYHISKVFRGERNQRGRFREFYQCDIDIIGNGQLSIIYDAEIPCIIYSTFRDLGFDDFTVRINSRKVLNGFFEYLGITEKAEVLRIVDKLEKIGLDAVIEELTKLLPSREAIDKIVEFIQIKGGNDHMLSRLREMGIDNPTFAQGVEELSLVVHYIRAFKVPEQYFALDMTIARGLDYYTGTVYETFLNKYPEIGSICSGGRYDNLAGYYTTQKLPGVGISIGLTRLFYQLRETKIISPDSASTLSQVLVIPMSSDMEYSINVANQLRANEIIAEIYFDETKVAKKFAYADKLGIPFAILIGPDEIKSDTVTLKNMRSGEQDTISFNDALTKIRQVLGER